MPDEKPTNQELANRIDHLAPMVDELIVAIKGPPNEPAKGLVFRVARLDEFANVCTKLLWVIASSAVVSTMGGLITAAVWIIRAMGA